MGRIVWFGRTWLFYLWQKTIKACSAGLRFGVDAVPVFYIECGCAGFGWLGVDYRSLFFSLLARLFDAYVNMN